MNFSLFHFRIFRIDTHHIIEKWKKEMASSIIAPVLLLVILAAAGVDGKEVRHAANSGTAEDCPCVYDKWKNSSACAWNATIGVCTNRTYVGPKGMCTFGHFTFSGRKCSTEEKSCEHTEGATLECACVTKARAKEGLEALKSLLMVFGIILLPGVFVAVWIVRTECCRRGLREEHTHHIGKKDFAQEKREQQWAMCPCKPWPQARGWQDASLSCCARTSFFLFMFWVMPLSFGGGGTALLVLSGNIAVDTDYWYGCGAD